MANPEHVDQKAWEVCMTSFYEPHTSPEPDGPQLGAEHHPSEVDPAYETPGVLAEQFLAYAADSHLAPVRWAARTPYDSSLSRTGKTEWRHWLKMAAGGVCIGAVAMCGIVLKQEASHESTTEAAKRQQRNHKGALTLLVDDVAVQRKLGLCASELDAQAAWLESPMGPSAAENVLPPPGRYRAAAHIARKFKIPCRSPEGLDVQYSVKIGGKTHVVTPRGFTIFDVETVCGELMRSQLTRGVDPTAKGPTTKGPTTQLDELRLELVEKENIPCE